MAARVGLELVSHCVLSLPAEYGKTTTEIMDTVRAYSTEQCTRKIPTPQPCSQKQGLQSAEP